MIACRHCSSGTIPLERHPLFAGLPPDGPVVDRARGERDVVDRVFGRSRPWSGRASGWRGFGTEAVRAGDGGEHGPFPIPGVGSVERTGPAPDPGSGSWSGPGSGPDLVVTFTSSRTVETCLCGSLEAALTATGGRPYVRVSLDVSPRTRKDPAPGPGTDQGSGSGFRPDSVFSVRPDGSQSRSVLPAGSYAVAVLPLLPSGRASGVASPVLSAVVPGAVGFFGRSWTELGPFSGWDEAVGAATVHAVVTS